MRASSRNLAKPGSSPSAAGDFGTFRVVDGIVVDRNGKTTAGPTAVILPHRRAASGGT